MLSPRFLSVQSSPISDGSATSMTPSRLKCSSHSRFHGLYEYPGILSLESGDNVLDLRCAPLRASVAARLLRRLDWRRRRAFPRVGVERFPRRVLHAQFL